MLILILLALAGSGMLFVGVRGLLTRRATIYSGKWLLALVAMCFLPQFLTGLKLSATLPTLALLNIGIYLFLLLVFWFVTKGHICFGISEETANDAFKSAFGGLGLKYEQFLGSVRLEDGGIFQIAIQDWMGTMQIKPKNLQAKARMAALVAGLTEYFSASNARVSCLAYWIYAICGGFLLASLLALLALLARIPHKKIPPPVQEKAAPSMTTRSTMPVLI